MYGTVESRYNEPLCNEVLGMTNDFLYPRHSERYMKKNLDKANTFCQSLGPSLYWASTVHKDLSQKLMAAKSIITGLVVSLHLKYTHSQILVRWRSLQICQLFIFTFQETLNWYLWIFHIGSRLTLFQYISIIELYLNSDKNSLRELVSPSIIIFKKCNKID